MFKPAKVICLMNEMPNLAKLSTDRYNIQMIIQNKIVELERINF